MSSKRKASITRAADYLSEHGEYIGARIAESVGDGEDVPSGTWVALCHQCPEVGVRLITEGRGDYFLYVRDGQCYVETCKTNPTEHDGDDTYVTSLFEQYEPAPVLLEDVEHIAEDDG